VARSAAGVTAVVEHADDWMLRAACNGVPPDLFFSDVREEIDRAKAICATCPVRADCDEYAQMIRPAYGVWAGFDATERRNLKRRRVRAARTASSPPSGRCPGCQLSGTTVPVGGGYGECVSCKARYPWPA
jgi:WhiB family redox-sensing transcriptional regulator